MKKKTILLAFASSDLKKSVERFQLQAQNSGYYNQIRIFTEKNIDEICLSKVKEIIKKSGGRGFGYWFWKPYLIEKILNQMNDNDILHYLDIGCHIINNKKKEFIKLIDLLENDKIGMLAFKYDKPKGEFDNNIQFPQREEFKFTKADVFNYFNYLNEKNIINTPQYWAGSIFIKKNSFTLKFVKEWLDIFYKNINLVNDNISVLKNFEGFIENRHDQSIYSLLCKKYNVTSLSAYYFDWIIKNNIRNWDLTNNSPFVAYRDLQYNLIKRFINRQKKNLRRIIKRLK